MSAFIEELPPPTDFMDVDVPLSPPRVYHPVTGTPLCSGSLVVHSPSPEASPPVSKPAEASASADGIKVPPKKKKTKNKGKGKVTAPDPVLARTPSPPAIVATSSAQEEPPPQKKKALKRKCAPDAVAPSEPGSSRPTGSSVTASKAAAFPSTAGGSRIAGPSVKKPHFSPKKVSKKASPKTTKAATSDTLPGSNRMFPGHPKQQFLATELTRAQDSDHEGIPIDRHNSRTELKDYHFKDLVMAPNEFFE